MDEKWDFREWFLLTSVLWSLGSLDLFGPTKPAFFMTVFGSATTIILIITTLLQSPMYFLFSQLSFMDLLYSSTFVPKISLDFLSGVNHISFIECGFQLFFVTLVGAEYLLLSVVAYDHSVSICYLPHYLILIHPEACKLLLLSAWLDSLFNTLIHD